MSKLEKEQPEESDYPKKKGSYEETEEYKRHERLIQKLQDMSEEERFQTIVDAGIVNVKGELTLRYGGVGLPDV